MMFQINYSGQARKFLKKIDRALAGRIVGKIEKLMDEQVPHDSKAVHGHGRIFRIRVGDYRVLYEVDYEQNMIGVVKIDKRQKVYE